MTARRRRAHSDVGLPVGYALAMAQPRLDGPWFHGTPERQHGPFTLAELRHFATQGRLPPSTLVWTEGMREWTPIEQLPRLFALVPATPPADAATRMLIPVGRSGWAIAAGYLGLLSFLPPVGPAAMVVSLVAARDLRHHPEKHGWGRVVTGLVLGLLGSVLYGLAFFG